MDRERYQLIKRILLAASEKTGTRRDTYLTETCGDDQELHDQVRQLLESPELDTGQVGAVLRDSVLGRLRSPPLDDERIRSSCAPGDFLGHYRIVEKIGEGGMGVVWKAVDTSLEREVAIKLLPVHWSGDSQRLARFRREAKVVASLNHPNIVVIHAVEPEGATPFMVMEFVPGRLLRQCIPAAGLPLHELLDYAIPVADAVAAAHEKGVTHRDLKPENVMVTTDGRVKVLDFGIAARANERIGSGTTAPHELTWGTRIGTLPYMSPEQIRGEPVDPRSDVFSLGIVLYEMAVGERPFRGDNEADLMASTLRDTAPAPSDRRPELPTSLDSVIAQCLEKERADRPQTAGPVRDAIVELRKHVEWAALRSLAYGGGAAPRTAAYPPSATSRKSTSIGVLPFLDLSPDGDQEHFCLGIAEDVATILSRIDGLNITVASRMNRDLVDPVELGRALRVDAILDGSVRLAGDRFRVTARVVSVTDGRQLWSTRSDRPRTDVFAIQDEVAEAVANHFDMELAPKRRATGAVRPEAYAAYLRGRHFWGRRYEGGLMRALECFAEALTIDPRMAAAHAGRSDCYVILGHYGLMKPHEAYGKAREGAQRALELAPDLAEAHTTMGWISAFFDWDWPAAGRWFGQALELDPGYATAWEWNGIHLLSRGHSDAALESMRKAQQLDPLSLMIGTILAWAHHATKRDEEALRILNHVLEMDPRFGFAHIVSGLALVATDREDEAVATLERAAGLSKRDSLYLGCLGYAYGEAGRRGDADTIVEELSELRQKRYVPALHAAFALLGAGRHEEAYRRLEQAVRDRDSFFSSAYPASIFDAVREEPRFRALLREMGLEPSTDASS